MAKPKKAFKRLKKIPKCPDCGSGAGLREEDDGYAYCKSCGNLRYEVRYEETQEGSNRVPYYALAWAASYGFGRSTRSEEKPKKLPYWIYWLICEAVLIALLAFTFMFMTGYQESMDFRTALVFILFAGSLMNLMFAAIFHGDM